MRPFIRWAAGLLALAVIAPRVRADDSVFGIRGLGLLGRPVSARSGAAAGAFQLFDPAGGTNPASLGRWGTVAGWAVGTPSRRTFVGGADETTLTSTRFPVFGFATVLGTRWVISASVSDYLDRSWGLRQQDSLVLRGVEEPVTDVSRSVGGVSDLRLGAAYHLNAKVDLGLAVHALTGSTRSTVIRDFANPAYADFTAVAVTDYRGLGLSLGAIVELRPTVLVSGTARVNSSLTARSDAGEEARVALPLELGAGVLLAPRDGVNLAFSAGYSGWARAGDGLVAAGQERSRNVWQVAVGGEMEVLSVRGKRLPARLGYRWRQLPFPDAGGVALNEHAVAGGLGVTLAGGRTTVDLGVERGTRAAGTRTERFTTGYVGVIVRP